MQDETERRESADEIHQIFATLFRPAKPEPPLPEPQPTPGTQRPTTAPDEGLGCVGWSAVFLGIYSSVPAAVVGGGIVTAARGVLLGVVAGLAGIVVGLLVTILIALYLKAESRSSVDVPDLRSLPASKRTGRGLRERRKVSLADAAREWAFVAIVFLGAPVAALLTGVVLLVITRR